MLAGECTGGEFWILNEFEVAERAFWKELICGVDTRKLLEAQIGSVQDAVFLGSLLDCFFLEDGEARVRVPFL